MHRSDDSTAAATSLKNLSSSTDAHQRDSYKLGLYTPLNTESIGDADYLEELDVEDEGGRQDIGRQRGGKGSAERRAVGDRRSSDQIGSRASTSNALWSSAATMAPEETVAYEDCSSRTVLIGLFCCAGLIVCYVISGELTHLLEAAADPIEGIYFATWLSHVLHFVLLPPMMLYVYAKRDTYRPRPAFVSDLHAPLFASPNSIHHNAHHHQHPEEAPGVPVGGMPPQEAEEEEEGEEEEEDDLSAEAECGVMCARKRGELAIQGVAIALAMLGVALLAYRREAENRFGVGIAVATLCAAMYAGFEVLYKWDLLGGRSKAPLVLVCTVVGLMGLVMTLLLWVPIFPLSLSGLEPLTRLLTSKQWLIICINGVVILGFQMCLQLSLCFLPNPLLVSLASLLSMPASQFTDWFLRTGKLTLPATLGSGFIGASFVIMVALETRKAQNAGAALSAQREALRERMRRALCIPPSAGRDVPNEDDAD
eukprot:GHVU01126196.1.p1 GENE.GHVU01126196.1~~GHVU01126196.1.p1  ORF type:complete len:482 (+),score=77.28 GHVU01126196.1:234-1679(+)